MNEVDLKVGSVVGDPGHARTIPGNSPQISITWKYGHRGHNILLRFGQKWLRSGQKAMIRSAHCFYPKGTSAVVVTSGPAGDDLKRWRGSWIIGIMVGRWSRDLRSHF